eukprot:1444828-Prymnesium_polylepis.1
MGLSSSPSDLQLATSADCEGLLAWPVLPPSPVAHGASCGASPVTPLGLDTSPVSTFSLSGAPMPGGGVASSRSMLTGGAGGGGGAG